MIQTFEEAALSVVLWWSEKAFRTPLNQNNGDESSIGTKTFLLMNTVSHKIQEQITDGQIKLFEDRLFELILQDQNSGSIRDNDLDVDYHPCEKLMIAANHCPY